MSTLPPPLIASSLQGAVQQHQAQQVRSVADRRQSDTSVGIVQATEQHETQIDDTEADRQVDPDGSGAGGQGRAFHEEPQPEAQQAGPAGDDGSVTTDQDGRMHVDITA
jgi:hypothetical protein